MRLFGGPILQDVLGERSEGDGRCEECRAARTGARFERTQLTSKIAFLSSVDPPSPLDHSMNHHARLIITTKRPSFPPRRTSSHRLVLEEAWAKGQLPTCHHSGWIVDHHVIQNSSYSLSDANEGIFLKSQQPTQSHQPTCSGCEKVVTFPWF